MGAAPTLETVLRQSLMSAVETASLDSCPTLPTVVQLLIVLVSKPDTLPTSRSCGFHHLLQCPVVAVSVSLSLSLLVSRHRRVCLKVPLVSSGTVGGGTQYVVHGADVQTLKEASLACVSMAMSGTDTDVYVSLPLALPSNAQC